MGSIGICFYRMFHTLFLLTGAACYLIRPRQIQPDPRVVRIQIDSGPIVGDGFIQIYARQGKISAEQFAIFRIRGFQADGLLKMRNIRDIRYPRGKVWAKDNATYTRHEREAGRRENNLPKQGTQFNSHQSERRPRRNSGPWLMSFTQSSRKGVQRGNR